MKRTIIVACRSCDTHLMEAFETGVDGLAVNQDPNCGDYVGSGNWHIIHVITGRSLGFDFPGPEEAMFAAARIDGFDWTQDFLDPDTRQAGMAYVDAVLGDIRYRDRQRVPLAVLNEVSP